jgi:hypothetical protein
VFGSLGVSSSGSKSNSTIGFAPSRYPEPSLPNTRCERIIPDDMGILSTAPWSIGAGLRRLSLSAFQHVSHRPGRGILLGVPALDLRRKEVDHE